MLKSLCSEDYLSIADQLMSEREQGQFPPFRHMAIFRAEADTMQNSLELLDAIKPSTTGPGIETWGPLPALIARRADRHRAQLVLLSSHRGRLNAVLSGICQHLDQQKLPPKVKWMVDVDPLEIG